MKERDLKAEGIFIAEGRFLVERALSSGLKLQSILCLPSLQDEFLDIINGLPADRRVPVFTAGRRELEDLCGFAFHRGVLAAGFRPSCPHPESMLPGASRLIVCSDIRDPFNLGGLFRSASALGWDGIVMVDGQADPFSRAALRASMGSVLDMPWISLETGPVELLKTSGFTIIGGVIPSSASSDIKEWDTPGGLPEKIALMVGNEGTGLSEERIRSCDNLVSIPMTDRVDSLNVGVAAGILMHALRSAV